MECPVIECETIKHTLMGFAKNSPEGGGQGEQGGGEPCSPWLARHGHDQGCRTLASD